MEKFELARISKRYGTMDIYVNDEEKSKELFKDGKLRHIIVYYNGEFAYTYHNYETKTFDDITKILDDFMGVFDRDTQNWSFMNIVIHWGIHTLKFTNNNNIEEFEDLTDKQKEEFDYQLEDTNWKEYERKEKEIEDRKELTI
jgi:hypothetical protein